MPNFAYVHIFWIKDRIIVIAILKHLYLPHEQLQACVAVGVFQDKYMSSSNVFSGRIHHFLEATSKHNNYQYIVTSTSYVILVF